MDLTSSAQVMRGVAAAGLLALAAGLVFQLFVYPELYASTERVRSEAKWDHDWGWGAPSSSAPPRPAFNETDLRARLDLFLHDAAQKRSRYAEDNTGSGSRPRLDVSSKNPWDGGFPQDALVRLARYWRESYGEWATRLQVFESSLGPSRTARINGLDIHYHSLIHKDSAEKKRKTVLLLHGWPGSVVEFHRVAPLLHETYGYDVVTPCLPGYGYSSAPSKSGFTVVDAAVAMIKLVRLVRPDSEFVCQGGDYGSFVCAAVGQLEATGRLVGVHTNFPVLIVPPLWTGSSMAYFTSLLFASREDVDKLYGRHGGVVGFFLYMLRETGYFHLQGSKPETIGQILEDTPVGTAAWIVEKFAAWSKDDPFEVFGMEHLLDNVMMYWATKTSTTSARWYRELSAFPNPTLTAAIPVKVGVVDAAYEITRLPKYWLTQRYPNLVRYTSFDKGGHFFAMEHPDELAREVDAFCRSL